MAQESSSLAHNIVTIWFAVSSVVVLWDAGFCLLRPRSMPGGDLYWIWAPYELYGTIDLVYGPGEFFAHNGFAAAQSYLNLVESALNFGYLALLAKGSTLAPLIGFSGALMTVSKTSLYWLMDVLCGPDGWCKTGHNDRATWWLLYAATNGAWLVAPAFVCVVLASDIATSLRRAESLTSRKAKTA